MTTRFRTRQAGEGKIGCFGTLAVLGILIAAAIKFLPVYYSNTELVKACNDDIAPMASRATEEEVAAQVRAKAKELEIGEALKSGAISVRILASGNDTPGNVHIGLRYTRTVDFYGVYSYEYETNENIDRTIYTNIK